MNASLRFAAIAFLISSASALRAQTVTPCARSYSYWTGTNVVAGDRSNPGPPYTATVKHSLEQKLADGNTIHWIAEVTQARDADGRTFEQRIQSCQLDSSGQPQLRVEVNIFDPKNKISTHWAIGPGAVPEVRVIHNHSVPPISTRAPAIPVLMPPHNEIVSETLGTRNIAGVEATGYRSTETVPAATAGSDLPIKVVQEHWMSTDKPRKTLMMMDDNPPFGRQTWEVTSLTLGPPDPSLFTPPAGYTLIDDSVPAQEAAKP